MDTDTNGTKSYLKNTFLCWPFLLIVHKILPLRTSNCCINYKCRITSGQVRTEFIVELSIPQYTSAALFFEERSVQIAFG